ncbi:complex I 24 kDa subunit family protein [Peptoniphilus timonensis]|uniref:NADH-quinone oxidoreductase subunit NuoE family protein n=1 Tax=Peptoniphilus timonensis TaxID=1268254 RepID=UPI0002FF7F98|nr:NAD(P)H-dependent oxidoreductase subunit E [Peptoniphilus timonensis]
MDLNTLGLDTGLLNSLKDYIDTFDDKENNIISILHYAQDIFGYLPKELQIYIARLTDLPASRINGIVTFYSFFSEKKVGQFKVDVCLGTACFVDDSQELLTAFKEQLKVDPDGLSEDGNFNVNSIRCLGACGIGPVVRVNDKIYGHVEVDDVKEIIKTHRQELEEAKI